MVETTFHFPQYPSGKKFPIGVPVTVLCHLKNDGKLPVNITSIMGSLNADKRFYDYLQNFTAAPFSTVVKPAEEITLSYKFVLNKDLEPEKYIQVMISSSLPSLIIFAFGLSRYLLIHKRYHDTIITCPLNFNINHNVFSRTVFYDREDRHFASTFFNKTIQAGMYEPLHYLFIPSLLFPICIVSALE